MTIKLITMGVSPLVGGGGGGGGGTCIDIGCERAAVSFLTIT